MNTNAKRQLLACFFLAKIVINWCEIDLGGFGAPSALFCAILVHKGLRDWFCARWASLVN